MREHGWGMARNERKACVNIYRGLYQMGWGDRAETLSEEGHEPGAG
jgi:hypothetical protein